MRKCELEGTKRFASIHTTHRVSPHLPDLSPVLLTKGELGGGWRRWPWEPTQRRYVGCRGPRPAGGARRAVTSTTPELPGHPPGAPAGDGGWQEYGSSVPAEYRIAAAEMPACKCRISCDCSWLTDNAHTCWLVRHFGVDFSQREKI